MKLDILAIGAHPDDVELGAGGTLINHIKKGQKVGIIDLTEGELGSRGTVATRYSEAAEAGKIMGIALRENLQMADGFFKNDREHQLKLIRLIRKYKPNVVLANAYHDRHPDHGRGGQLIEDACFLSGLRKIETFDGDTMQEAWRPARVFHYVQDRFIQPDFIVDISESFAQKMEAVRSYGTQFGSVGDGPVTYISQPGFLQNIESRAQQMGHAIGVRYGEGFCSRSAIGLADLDDLLYPELA
jgi:bacillithiol biosynthesis deacetylase BshB1